MNAKLGPERTTAESRKSKTRSYPVIVAMAVKVFFLVVLMQNTFVAPCRGASVTWVGGSGDWGDTNNWSGGLTPGPNDDAVIDSSYGDITVTVSSGIVQINSLDCQETLLMNGGTIQDGNLTMSGAGALVVQSGTLDGVTVNGTLDVGNTCNGANLTVTNGLVLNGTALVGNPTDNEYGGIGFAGNQVLGGSGTVVFGADSYGGWGLQGRNALWVVDGGTTLVVGPGITVRGQNGWVGAYAATPWSGPANVSVVNQGAISVDVSGGTIGITAQPFINQGLAQAADGAVVVSGTSFTNSGQLLKFIGGGSFTLNASTLNSGLIEADHGVITFCGGFTQTVGTLNFGLSSPTDFGQISLTGVAFVGGVLASQLDGGYLPNPGGSFAVLNYGTNNIAFTNLNPQLLTYSSSDMSAFSLSSLPEWHSGAATGNPATASVLC